MAAGAGQVRMFSDDGICVHDPLLMRRALEYATGLGVLIAQHAEEPRLTVGAVAHEGPNAARLGLAGWPRAAEESIVARDALLARDAGARVHICHASTAGTVEIIRWAKEQGISITAEVTPHHLLLDDTAAGHLRRPQPGQPAAARSLRRRGAAPGTGRRRHRLRRHRPRSARRTREVLRVLGRPARHARTADRAVRRRRDDGAARVADVARRRTCDEREARPHRRIARPGPPLEVGEPANLTVVDPDATWTVAGSDAGEPLGQHSVRVDGIARGRHPDPVARQGHRSRREEPGVNTGTLVGSLIMAAVLAVVIAVLIRAMMRGWRRRARAAGGTDRHPAADAGHRGRGASSPRPRDCTSAARWCRTGTTASPSATSAYRTKAVLTRYPEGIMLQRTGAGPIWIPDDSITAIRTEWGVAGKVVAARRHPCHPVAAAVGHRDRHRLSRRQPGGIRPLA